MRSLISLARERERVGHRLELVQMPYTRRLNPDIVEELRGCVGEVRVGALEEGY